MQPRQTLHALRRTAHLRTLDRCAGLKYRAAPERLRRTRLHAEAAAGTVDLVDLDLLGDGDGLMGTDIFADRAAADRPGDDQTVFRRIGGLDIGRFDDEIEQFIEHVLYSLAELRP